MKTTAPTQQPTATMPVEKLMTLRQVADVLGVSERTVWSLAASGSLRSVRIGVRRRLFDPADVRAYVESHKTTAE